MLEELRADWEEASDQEEGMTAGSVGVDPIRSSVEHTRRAFVEVRRNPSVSNGYPSRTRTDRAGYWAMPPFNFPVRTGPIPPPSNGLFGSENACSMTHPNLRPIVLQARLDIAIH